MTDRHIGRQRREEGGQHQRRIVVRLAHGAEDVRGVLEPGDLYLEEHFAVRQERHEVSEGIRPLLEPIATLRTCEAEGDFSRRLALLEELKSMPFSAVWDQFCLQAGVPVGAAWIDPVKAYERTVQSRR